MAALSTLNEVPTYRSISSVNTSESGSATTPSDVPTVLPMVGPSSLTEASTNKTSSRSGISSSVDCTILLLTEVKIDRLSSNTSISNSGSLITLTDVQQIL